MAFLKSFDPSYYLVNGFDCDTFKNQLDELDTLGISTLVGDFASYMQDSDVPHQGIFTILSPAGHGKTFFLSKLYCHLKSIDKIVLYIDILQYADMDSFQELKRYIQTESKKNLNQNIIILFDNIEKHTGGIAVDFITVLDSLVRNKNITCVLAYDDAVLQKKLYTLFGDGEDTQHLFQRYIDVEFYLDVLGNRKDKYYTDIFAKEQHSWQIDSVFGSLIEVLLTRKIATLAQVDILIKKISFFYKNQNKTSYMERFEESFFIFFFLLLKIVDKEQYREYLERYELSYQNMNELLEAKENTSLNKKLREVLGQLENIYNEFDRQQNDLNLNEWREKDRLEILQKMELINV